MKEKKQSMLDVLQRLEAVENELKDIRDQIVQNMNEVAHQSECVKNYEVGYTLDDIYNAFGKSKKHYATRLRHSLEKKDIKTLQEFLALTPGQLLELENVSVGTLEQTKKVFDRLGISW